MYFLRQVPYDSSLHTRSFDTSTFHAGGPLAGRLLSQPRLAGVEHVVNWLRAQAHDVPQPNRSEAMLRV